MRVLIVEDDAAIAEAVVSAMRQQGHAVDHLADGSRADLALRDTEYQLLVLDLGLLGPMDGVQVLQRLRARAATTAVLVITAREGLEDRVQVLDLGADDYLVKPFALKEFEARVRSLLRRMVSQGAPELRLGQLRLDLAGHRAWIGEDPLELTAREFGLLGALATRTGRVASRAQLVEVLCGWDADISDNGLDIAMYRLRRKLQGSGVGVRTIRGLGYLLQEQQDTGDDP
ncbi:response regulator [Pseudoxanthomonas winnipegensis]|uniref:Response regulator transcription factor n=1 Tax=Pseudoxanthomonas winnipegensis TaxID=2480810 RepID=A0A4Q8M2R8_9GAMM|nr:response regulator transcription factor [Pseudoxanthomonas winnipegensis]TAA38799.1 response regulator transcription factor [Pseudoxanthomonas winnipegensis]